MVERALCGDKSRRVRVSSIEGQISCRVRINISVLASAFARHEPWLDNRVDGEPAFQQW